MKKCPVCGSHNTMYIGIDENAFGAMCDEYDCEDCGFSWFCGCTGQYTEWINTDCEDIDNDNMEVK